MARGIKGTGLYSRQRYTGDVHWFWIVLWFVVFFVVSILAIAG